MIDHKPRVLILMAVFNGEKFLDIQLNSIAEQTGVSVEVWVNDDGSQDSTLQIVKDWKSRGLITIVMRTQRVGHAQAFVELVRAAAKSNSHDFIAFSDQDDIWDANKLIQTLNGRNTDLPTLWCSMRRTLKGSSNGRLLAADCKEIKVEFRNALIQNVIYMNTVLVNPSGLQLISRYLNPGIYFLDAWMYLVFISFGSIRYTQTATMTYRLHQHNAVGLRTRNPFALFVNFQKIIDQSLIFCQTYTPELSTNTRCDAIAFESFARSGHLAKIRTIWKLPVKRQSKIETKMAKFALLLLPTRSTKVELIR